MEIFQSRDEISQLIKFKESPVIAEIGVFECEFSKKLHSWYNPKELHLFDTFRNFNVVGSGNVDGNDYRETTGEKIYNNAVDAFKNQPNVFLHEGFSNVTVAEMQDEYFDLIYIDGDHSEEGVYNDLINSYNKVKDHGWITGHDFGLNKAKCKNNWDFSGIRRAVSRFCAVKNLQIDALFLDGCISFAIQKKSAIVYYSKSGLVVLK